MSRAATREEVSAERAAAIRAMVASLRNSEDRSYYVGLVRYYIEGIAYSASGLSVDLTTTPDISLTETGFFCTAMFPPEILEPNTVAANGITKVSVRGELHDIVHVRLDVVIEDVWSVAEFIDGKQCDLFLDPETLRSGLSGSNTAH